MSDFRVKGEIFTERERTVIREAAELFDGERIDLRDPQKVVALGITAVLSQKLRKTITVTATIQGGYVFGPDLLNLVQEFDAKETQAQNADQWEKWGQWLKSKKWSFPVAVFFVGLPLLVQYLQMAKWIIDYFFGAN